MERLATSVVQTVIE